MSLAFDWLDIFSFPYLTGTKASLSEQEKQGIRWRMPSHVICARFLLHRSALYLFLMFLFCICQITRKMTEVEQMINSTRICLSCSEKVDIQRSSHNTIPPPAFFVSLIADYYRIKPCWQLFCNTYRVQLLVLEKPVAVRSRGGALAAARRGW